MRTIIFGRIQMIVKIAERRDEAMVISKAQVTEL